MNLEEKRERCRRIGKKRKIKILSLFRVDRGSVAITESRQLSSKFANYGISESEQVGVYALQISLRVYVFIYYF